MIDFRRKIKTIEQAALIVEESKHQGLSVVFTNGCFDILHIGHVQYLEDAKKLGDLLVVGVNSDSSVKSLKGEQRPINICNHRMGLLAALESIDLVVAFDELNPLKLIQKLKPQILVKGGDWSIDQIIGASEVLSSGGEVHSLPLVEGISTSIIEEKILRRKS